MILDRFERVGLYFAASSPYARAVAFAREAAAALPDGVHLIDGDRLKANVESYMPRAVSERRFEAHRRYGDVQVMLAGAERQDYSPDAHPEELVAYDATKDIAFFKPLAAFTAVHLLPGWFVVYQPGELHRPGVMLDEASGPVRKVCMKILC